MPDLPLARFRSTIHYDGTAFKGWQLQPAVRTVQQEVEAALSRLLPAQGRVAVVAAGRTDTGVHAVGQEISFEAPATWEAAELERGLNALLAEDVWIERLSQTDAGFHPRFDAVARRYEYLASDGPEGGSPVLRRACWDLRSRRPFDERELTEISAQVVGEHSFAAFSKSGQPERGTHCRVESARWSRSSGGLLHFTIVADRFLHRMVRYLVATMIDVAASRRSREELGWLLTVGSRIDSPEAARVRPPVPAPARGLYLTGVQYDEGWNRPAGIPGIVMPESNSRVDGS